MHTVSAVARAMVGLALSLALGSCGASRRREVGDPVTIIVVPAGRPVPVFHGAWPTVMRTPDAGTPDAGTPDAEITDVNESVE